MPALPDGDYDVFVVDAEPVDDGTIRIEITVVSGDAKGEIVVLRGPVAGRDAIDLLGLPGTLVVAGGVPKLNLDGA